jgi:hypothetical protein
MERREEREIAALPNAVASTSDKEERPKVRPTMPAWLPQGGRPAMSLSSRERDGERGGSGGTEGERERIMELEKK